MTTALGALLIGVAGAALLLALAAYLWVNRTPSTDERFDLYGRVPLFGVDLSGAAAQHVDADGADTTRDEGAAPPRPLRTADDVMNDQPAPVGAPVMVVDGGTATARAQSPFAPPAAPRPMAPLADLPLGGSRFSEPHVAEARLADARYPETQLPHTPPSNGAVPASERFVGQPPHARAPLNKPGAGRLGWGATPGWPVAPDGGLNTTPTYVPPVKPDGINHRPAAPAASNGKSVLADGVSGSMVEGHQLRFSTPAEGTLQFLPGRLEISSGLDNGREIRFVRVPGPNGTEVTFGRNEGPLYRHIQLRDQTVSREHARLVFGDGQWVLTNLSRTNPVAHNGRILRSDEQQPLSDGDRLEMGEVIFNFRSR